MKNTNTNTNTNTHETTVAAYKDSRTAQELASSLVVSLDTARTILAHRGRRAGSPYDGGLFVGTSPGGTVWVARDSKNHTQGEAYKAQRERLTGIWNRHMTRTGR